MPGGVAGVPRDNPRAPMPIEGSGGPVSPSPPIRPRERRLALLASVSRVDGCPVAGTRRARARRARPGAQRRRRRPVDAPVRGFRLCTFVPCFARCRASRSAPRARGPRRRRRCGATSRLFADTRDDVQRARGQAHRGGELGDAQRREACVFRALQDRCVAHRQRRSDRAAEHLRRVIPGEISAVTPSGSRWVLVASKLGVLAYPVRR